MALGNGVSRGYGSLEELTAQWKGKVDSKFLEEAAESDQALGTEGK